nr:hypothetical protein [Kibdelosporangium sp. MJ126-NF4]CEL23347.1 hypothetical protein [Kibdelosporangium sp. MJ126-NF4]CTQ94509.1 hypothetical protein [Kibdelosporangium sp. MJ126-NF4]
MTDLILTTAKAEAAVTDAEAMDSHPVRWAGGVMRARVWLAAGPTETEVASPAAVGVVAVRDDQLRVWRSGSDGDWWHTADGLHHATWRELHVRFDLVEVNL